MIGRYTIFDLLSTSARARSLVDPRVARTIAWLARNGLVPEMPTDAVLAAACLGDPVSAILRLTDAGVLPDELPEEQRRALSARLSLGSTELSPRGVLANPRRVAVFLGLPEAHSAKAAPLPTGAAPAYGLFPHQRRAVAQARLLLRKGRTRLLVQIGRAHV